jgi:hypothetical protein
LFFFFVFGKEGMDIVVSFSESSTPAPFFDGIGGLFGFDCVCFLAELSFAGFSALDIVELSLFESLVCFVLSLGAVVWALVVGFLWLSFVCVEGDFVVLSGCELERVATLAVFDDGLFCGCFVTGSVVFDSVDALESRVFATLLLVSVRFESFPSRGF